MEICGLFVTERTAGEFLIVLFSDAVCHEPYFIFFESPTNVQHLVGLACTTWTGVSRELDYHIYDALHSTLTYLLHYDVLRFVMAKRLEAQYYTVTSGLLVRYKATLSRGMSSECSWFIVLQSDPHSPLSSTLYLLPKDQTLKRVIKHPRSYLALPNTSHPRNNDQTLSPHDLVSSRGSHKRLQTLVSQTTL